MYNTLLRLPLFQGITGADLTDMVGKIKLHFIKYQPGQLIAQSGNPCHQLIYLLSGNITSALPLKEDLLFTEYICTPYHLIEPYSLFGKQVTYNSTYTACTEVHTLTINKACIVGELLRYDIFRFNYLNTISRRAQTQSEYLCKEACVDPADKIIRFILIHSEIPDGEKRLQAKMDNLARHFGENRLNISKALNTLQEEGLAILNRKEVIIPNASLLAQRIQEKDKKEEQ